MCTKIKSGACGAVEIISWSSQIQAQVKSESVLQILVSTSVKILACYIQRLQMVRLGVSGGPYIISLPFIEGLKNYSIWISQLKDCY